MKVLILVFTVFLVIAVEANKGKHNIQDFDCTGKDHGDYPHPISCEKYVTCSSNGVQEQDCPTCLYHPLDCPQGKLHWSTQHGKCERANIAQCATECDPLECEQEGDCDYYKTCNEDTHSWQWINCNEGNEDVDWDNKLWWNPNFASPTNGICDYWHNLSPEVQESYRNKEHCDTQPLPCHFRQDESCDNKFWYLENGSKNYWQEQAYVCPNGLYWNHQVLNCGHCRKDKCTDCPHEVLRHYNLKRH